MSFSSIFRSYQYNCATIAYRLVRLLQVPITQTTLINELSVHPYPDSLLGISDVLAKYGVKNKPVKLPLSKLTAQYLPLIAQIKGKADRQSFFTVVSAIEGDRIRYYDPEKQTWCMTRVEALEKRWTGVALLAAPQKKAGEREYMQHRRQEKVVQISRFVAWLLLPFTTITSIVLYSAYSGWQVLYPALFLLTYLAGALITFFILWYETDQHIPLLKQICSGNKGNQCLAVLQSDSSKIVGISWSVIGFTYFLGGLLGLLVTGMMNPAVLSILSWLTVPAILYVAFSIYYQWRIVKQWCTLCLTIQCLLLLQLCITLVAGWRTAIPFPAGIQPILSLMLLYLVPFLIVHLFIIPMYKLLKQHKHHETALVRLTCNPQVFTTLLSQEKALTESTEGLGLILGNPGATNKIVKICDPYCMPCALSHPTIESILDNNRNVQVQIIFRVSYEDDPIKKMLIKHLLSIAEKGDEDLLKHALSDWYLAEQKSFEIFSAKYPVHEKPEPLLDTKLNKMCDWFNKTGIVDTPTFFVNGYQLPAALSVNDLKFMLTY